MTDTEALKIVRQAYFDAQRRRPYAASVDVIAAITPGGGDWQCVARDGRITRSIFWNGREVALMNPAGDLDDGTEGQIAMAVRALPTMDTALRAIIVLAESDGNLTLIRDLAVSVIEFVERPAPRIKKPESDADGEPAAAPDPEFRLTNETASWEIWLKQVRHLEGNAVPWLEDTLRHHFDRGETPDEALGIPF